MKKNLVILTVIVIVLAIAVFILFKTQRSSTIKPELRDFAVEDTASITKIFLADKENRTITLDRKNGFWMVNNQFEARPDAIQTLLKTIHSLSVKSPVPQTAHETIIKNLSVKSTKVEIYKGDELIKTYYVGHATKDQTGTYMLLEGSSVPFVMHLQGFSGYLSTRYFMDIEMWQAPRVFKYHYSDIRTVTSNHVKEPKKSFKLSTDGNDNFQLLSLTDSVLIEDFDTADVKFFLSNFRELNYDRVLSSIDENKKDSIISATPDIILTVEDVTGKTNTLKLWKKVKDNSKPLSTEEAILDLDVLYALTHDDLFVLVQYFVFDPVLVGVEYFTEKDKTKMPVL